MTPYIPAAEGGKNFYYAFSLVDFDGVPIVFLATDDDNNVFLCECTDSRFGEQNWTIGFTDHETVVRLIHREITLYEAFSKANKPMFVVVCDLDTGMFTQKKTAFEMLKEEDLPDVCAKVLLTNENAMKELDDLFMEHSSSSSIANPIIPGFVACTSAREMFIAVPLLDKIPFHQSVDPTSITVVSSQGLFNCNGNGVEAA